MDLQHALEELYSSSPDVFTARRDAIVKELKAAGDKDGAAALGKRKKPTQVAFVLNQLSRVYPDDVAQLVDVGRELARAHRKTMRGGGGTELAHAIAAQRKAVSTLTSKVSELLSKLELKQDALLADVAGALQAALVDAGAAAALEAGQLEKAPQAPGTFGFGADETENEESEGIAAAAPARRAPSSKQRDADDRRSAAERKRAERAASAAERRTEAARERQAKRRDREAAEAAARARDEQLRSLTTKAEEAEALAIERVQTADELEEEAARLLRDAKALAEEAKRARTNAERAQQDAADARALLERTLGGATERRQRRRS